MACRGGCIAGGGQPYNSTDDIREKRIAGIYQDDKKSALRCSHHNPAVKELYSGFLGKPLSGESHKLLHTHYTPRPVYSR
jgi:NADH-quinone oxidoreductase subunit G